MKFIVTVFHQIEIDAEDQQTAFDIIEEQYPTYRISGCTSEVAISHEQNLLFASFCDGYKDGLEWLTLGTNFKYYKDDGGYIPNGPSKYNGLIMNSHRMNDAWQKGWTLGVDAYKETIDNDVK